MKMEILLGAVIGGVIVHLLHISRKPHNEPQTTRAVMRLRGCACDACESQAKEGSDYCEAHWWYEPQNRN